MYRYSWQGPITLRMIDEFPCCLFALSFDKFSPKHSKQSIKEYPARRGVLSNRIRVDELDQVDERDGKKHEIGGFFMIGLKDKIWENSMPGQDPLIPKHGGYRKLKSFQVAQLVYDVTVRFCDRYFNVRSRTHDQMVQAARSGVQNIAEGSQASGTSKKMELKLTNVARASLEELRLDYEDFLRQRGLGIWDREDPKRQAIVDRRCKTAEEVAAWVKEMHKSGRSGPSRQSGQDKDVAVGPSVSTGSTGSIPPSYPEIAANAAIALTTVAMFLLDRQLAAQAAVFEQEGGFTERLYHHRAKRRNNS